MNPSRPSQGPSPYGSCAFCARGAVRIEWLDEAEGLVHRGYLCSECAKTIRRVAPHLQRSLQQKFAALRHPYIAERLGWTPPAREDRNP